MKKVFQSRMLLLAVLFILAISAYSFIAYSRSRAVCTEATKCCLKANPNGSSEMLWDVLSHQFVSSVHF